MTPPRSNGKAATFESIMAAEDLPPRVPVTVKEWGLTVYVRGLTRGQIVALQADDGTDPEHLNAQFIALGLVEPELTVEQAKEILVKKGFDPAQQLVDAIQKASGLEATFPTGEET